MDMQRDATTEMVVRGGRVLLPGEGLVEADVVIDSGAIVEISRKPLSVGTHSIDAQDCLVLPGIVDIHGDAFERQIMPRPKTLFPLDIAMAETDRQLVANGITTAYHGITMSWEPGLRSIAQSLKVIDAIDALGENALADHRVHIRWETFAIDEVPAVIALMHRAKKPMLAFNDHTLPSLNGTRVPGKLKGSAERALMDEASYIKLLDQRRDRMDEVPIAIEVLARIALENGIAMLSHDDTTAEMRMHFRSLGVKVAEFPMNWETAEDAAAHGDDIVLGSPNVVRGGSHNGAISATEAIRRKQCTLLASDYYYPAPLHAALALDATGVLSLPDAWALVSGTPARIAGLDDRGLIAVGKRADILVVAHAQARVRAALQGGRLVYQAG